MRPSFHFCFYHLFELPNFSSFLLYQPYSQKELLSWTLHSVPSGNLCALSLFASVAQHFYPCPSYPCPFQVHWTPITPYIPVHAHDTGQVIPSSSWVASLGKVVLLGIVSSFFPLRVGLESMPRKMAGTPLISPIFNGKVRHAQLSSDSCNF